MIKRIGTENKNKRKFISVVWRITKKENAERKKKQPGLQHKKLRNL